MAAQPQEQYTIEVEHLVKRYPKAPVNAVDDISLACGVARSSGCSARTARARPPPSAC